MKWVKKYGTESLQSLQQKVSRNFLVRVFYENLQVSEIQLQLYQRFSVVFRGSKMGTLVRNG